jgi:small-conductance mechanosensitive channel
MKLRESSDAQKVIYSYFIVIVAFALPYAGEFPDHFVISFITSILMGYFSARFMANFMLYAESSSNRRNGLKLVISPFLGVGLIFLNFITVKAF